MHLDDEVITSALLRHEGVDWRIRFSSQAADAVFARYRHSTVPGARPALEKPFVPGIAKDGHLRTGVCLPQRFEGRHGDEEVADTRRCQHPDAGHAVEYADGGRGAHQPTARGPP